MRFEALDERFGGTDGDEWMERLFADGRWTEGPAYFPAGPLPGLQRHPQRPDAALGRDDRRGRRLRAAGRLRQRAHRRPPGAPGQLRARQPPGHPRRARRHDHRARRPGRRQAPQQPQRRGRAGRRVGVVHRPVVRDRQRLRGPPVTVRGGRLPRLPGRPGIGRTWRSWPTTSSVPTGSRSAPTRRRSTSWTPAGRTSAGSPSPATRSRAARSSPPATTARSTGCGSTPTGRVWAAAYDGLHCFAPDGTLLGKLLVPEIVANLTFGGPKLNHLFITATTSVYTLRVKFNGCRYPR